MYVGAKPSVHGVSGVVTVGGVLSQQQVLLVVSGQHIMSKVATERLAVHVRYWIGHIFWGLPEESRAPSVEGKGGYPSTPVVS